MTTINICAARHYPLDCHATLAMTIMLAVHKICSPQATHFLSFIFLNYITKSLSHFITNQPSPSHLRATPLRGRGIKNGAMPRFFKIFSRTQNRGGLFFPRAVCGLRLRGDVPHDVRGICALILRRVESISIR